MKKLIVILGLAGVALFTVLLVKQGLNEIGHALATAGWGLVVVALFHVLPMMVDALSWRQVMPPGMRLSVFQVTWMRGVAEAINNLLPAAQVGGDVARARLASHTGMPMSIAMASMVVDFTSCILTQALFTLAGLGLLIMQHGSVSFGWQLVFGALVAKFVFLAFYFVQRKGLFAMFQRIGSTFFSGPTWEKLIQGGAAFDREINAIYRRWPDVLMSLFWTFLAWVIGAGEVWLGLYFLGHPVTIVEAMIIESLSQAVKGAVFMVPGALGFLEGGFIVIGKLFGIPPEIALSMALVKRFREISLGLPGLIAWQVIEGKRLFGKTISPAPTD